MIEKNSRKIVFPPPRYNKAVCLLYTIAIRDIPRVQPTIDDELWGGFDHGRRHGMESLSALPALYEGNHRQRWFPFTKGQ